MPSLRSHIANLISEDLVKSLEEVFPNRCPNPNDSERVIWMKAGNHEVVEYLKGILQESEENLLGTTSEE